MCFVLYFALLFKCFNQFSQWLQVPTIIHVKLLDEREEVCKERIPVRFQRQVQNILELSRFFADAYVEVMPINMNENPCNLPYDCANDRTTMLANCLTFSSR